MMSVVTVSEMIRRKRMGLSWVNIKTMSDFEYDPAQTSEEGAEKLVFGKLSAICAQVLTGYCAIKRPEFALYGA